MTSYRVDMLESEAGWGSRIDERKYFTGKNSKAKAEEYVKDYNKTYNNQPTTPSWYIVATEPVLVTDEEAKAALKKLKPKKKAKKK